MFEPKSIVRVKYSKGVDAHSVIDGRNIFQILN